MSAFEVLNGGIEESRQSAMGRVRSITLFPGRELELALSASSTYALNVRWWPTSPNGRPVQPDPGAAFGSDPASFPVRRRSCCVSLMCATLPPVGRPRSATCTLIGGAVVRWEHTYVSSHRRKVCLLCQGGDQDPCCALCSVADLRALRPTFYGDHRLDAAPVAPEVLRITAMRSITKIYFG